MFSHYCLKIKILHCCISVIPIKQYAWLFCNLLVCMWNHPSGLCSQACGTCTQNNGNVLYLWFKSIMLFIPKAVVLAYHENNNLMVPQHLNQHVVLMTSYPLIYWYYVKFFAVIFEKLPTYCSQYLSEVHTFSQWNYQH